MNEDIFKGKWKELKGSVKEKWGDLTDDDVTAVEGKTEKLVGILQVKYGYSKDEAQEEYDKFMDDNK
ncbi:putative stress response protein [Candidatus Desulfosporosinus infrequens]|uniref:Putative stress response protein n=1 Tax=Candidatus Desulfosporosinus infrequens TaxID=2043169 RepID=A0A2U3KMD8_9FIRM|nr:CsbD family protein [Desulfosporosinus sp.]SPF40806.1 putative stress response protein [Candidatus Desulfosporosinus infrequens]